MQTKGLVVRRPHPTDRRSTLVALTARGRRGAELMGRLFRDDIGSALDVPVDHLRELADLLDRIAAALRHRAGDVNLLRRRLLREDTTDEEAGREPPPRPAPDEHDPAGEPAGGP